MIKFSVTSVNSSVFAYRETYTVNEHADPDPNFPYWGAGSWPARPCNWITSGTSHGSSPEYVAFAQNGKQIESYKSAPPRRAGTTSGIILPSVLPREPRKPVYNPPKFSAKPPRDPRSTSIKDIWSRKDRRLRASWIADPARGLSIYYMRLFVWERKRERWILKVQRYNAVFKYRLNKYHKYLKRYERQMKKATSRRGLKIPHYDVMNDHVNATFESCVLTKLTHQIIRHGLIYDAPRDLWYLNNGYLHGYTRIHLQIGVSEWQALRQPESLAPYYRRELYPLIKGLPERSVVRLRKKIRDGKVKLGVFLAESRESVELVGQLVQLVDRLSRALVKASRPRKGLGLTRRGALLRSLGELAIDANFGYEFGVEPLISDLCSLYTIVKRFDSKLLSDFVQIKGRVATRTVVPLALADLTLSGRSGKFNGYLSYSVTAHLQVVNPLDHFIGQLGLNPFQAGWEALTLSFVVEWLLPIGEALERITDLAGVSNINTSEVFVLKGMFYSDDANVAEFSPYVSGGYPPRDTPGVTEYVEAGLVPGEGKVSLRVRTINTVSLDGAVLPSLDFVERMSATVTSAYRGLTGLALVMRRLRALAT